LGRRVPGSPRRIRGRKGRIEASEARPEATMDVVVEIGGRPTSKVERVF
jgi:hypothetical protein